jgi:hypothetical protein
MRGQAVAESVVGRKKSGRRTIATKIDAVIVRKAQTVADDLGVPVSEYLSGLLRERVERDWLKIVKRAAEAEGGE